MPESDARSVGLLLRTESGDGQLLITFSCRYDRLDGGYSRCNPHIPGVTRGAREDADLILLQPPIFSVSINASGHRSDATDTIAMVSPGPQSDYRC